MKRSLLTVLSMVTILAAAGAAFASPLPEGKWRLDRYQFHDKLVLPVNQGQVTLNISKDGKMGGRGGCNAYGASYEFDNGRLKVTDIISTKMACDEATMIFENAYFDLLRRATRVVEEGGKLTLLDRKTADFIRFVRIETKDEPRECY